jgi:peptidase MA superfamily protein
MLAGLGLLCGALLAGLALDAHARSDSGADGNFERRESSHFVLYQDVDLDEYGGFNGTRRFEQEVLKQLEASFDQLDRLLGLRPERKLDVHIWDAGIFDQQFRELFRFPAAGFYGGSIHIRGDTQVTRSLTRVLHHELVHAAFDAAAPRLVLPAWMNEGIAEWFEARAMGKRGLSNSERNFLRAAARDGRLFSLAQLSSPSLGGFPPNAAQLAYLESYGFIAYLVDAHGEKKLVQFSSEVLRSRSFERASRRAFSRDFEDLEAGYFKTLGAH